MVRKAVGQVSLVEAFFPAPSGSRSRCSSTCAVC
jgi:hypothetical protein